MSFSTTSSHISSVVISSVKSISLSAVYVFNSDILSLRSAIGFSKSSTCFMKLPRLSDASRAILKGETSSHAGELPYQADHASIKIQPSENHPAVFPELSVQ